jgi:hypothetical protein
MYLLYIRVVYIPYILVQVLQYAVLGKSSFSLASLTYS